jgi:predicted nucleotidyltransferase
MDKKECEQIIKKLREVLKKLSQELPVKINRGILFGSYARGEAEEESDLDLILVSESFRGLNYLERINQLLDLEWKLIDALDKPFDLLFYSPEEWEREDLPIIRIAKEEGIEIYSEEREVKNNG